LRTNGRHARPNAKTKRQTNTQSIGFAQMGLLMAGKKPAKRSASTIVIPKEDYGKPTLYVGLTPDANHVCPECGKKTKRAIIREYKGVLLCSKNCVIKVKRKEIKTETV